MIDPTPVVVVAPTTRGAARAAASAAEADFDAVLAATVSMAGAAVLAAPVPDTPGDVAAGAPTGTDPPAAAHWVLTGSAAFRVVPEGPAAVADQSAWHRAGAEAGEDGGHEVPVAPGLAGSEAHRAPSQATADRGGGEGATSGGATTRGATDGGVTLEQPPAAPAPAAPTPAVAHRESAIGTWHAGGVAPSSPHGEAEEPGTATVGRVAGGVARSPIEAHMPGRPIARGPVTPGEMPQPARAVGLAEAASMHDGAVLPDATPTVSFVERVGVPDAAAVFAEAARHAHRRGDGSHRMVLRLDPPELGTVHADLVVRGEEVHVSLRCDPGATHPLREARGLIERALQGQGFTLGGFDVSGRNDEHRPRPQGARPGSGPLPDAPQAGATDEKGLRL